MKQKSEFVLLNGNEKEKNVEKKKIKRSRSILTPKKILNEQNKLITPTTENPRQKKVFKQNRSDTNHQNENDEQLNIIKKHSIHLLNPKNNQMENYQLE
jgi:hypothetical protein